MEGEGDAEMAAKLKRFVNVHGVGVLGLLQRLSHSAFPFPGHSLFFLPLAFSNYENSN